MTRLLIVISMALLCSIKLCAQFCPQNTELGSTIDIWDWKQQEFEVYIRNTTTGTTNFEIIHSPFHGNTVSQPNTDHLRLTNLLDYFPEDGWELIYKEFGEENNGVRMPSFSLYNRFAGKLRIFYFLADVDGVNELVLFLKNERQNFDYISGILEHAFTPMDVIENYQDKEIEIEIPNYFEGNAGLWIMADIPTAYDPCTCKFPSALKAKNISITTDSLYINLQGNGSIEQIIDAGQNLENENQLFNINKLSSAVTAGSKAYKNSGKFIKDGDKSLAGKISDKLKKDSTMKNIFELFDLDSIQGSDIKTIFSIADTTTNPQFTQFVKDISKTSLTAYLPNWLKSTIPYVGAVAGILEFFSGSSTTKPMNFSVDLNFVGNGAIVSTNDLQSNLFYTPGANHINNNSSVVPVYDNILGVANLMERPDVFSAQEAFNIGNGTLIGVKKSYKLSKSIAYAFNPATGLNIEDVSAAIYFNDCEKGIDLEAENFNFEELGLELPNLIEEPNNSWRTPYLPLSCLENYSIFIHEGIFETEVADGVYEQLLVGLKCNNPPTFHFILNLNESLFAATYNVDYSLAPYSYENTPENPFTNIPENVTTDDINKVISDEVQAWNEITVTGGGQITNDNIDKINSLLPKITTIIYNDSEDSDRPSSIELVESPLTFDIGSTLPDNFVVINRPDCDFTPPVDASYLAGFCSDVNKYNPIALLRKDDMDAKKVVKKSFQLSPNPTNGIVRLDFFLDQERMINIHVYNLVGQEVLRPCVDQRFVKGEYSLQFNIEKFPSGTFIVEFISDDKKEVRKVIKL